MHWCLHWAAGRAAAPIAPPPLPVRCHCSAGRPPARLTSELLLPPDHKRRLGDAVSQRLHTLLTSEDPDQVLDA